MERIPRRAAWITLALSGVLAIATIVHGCGNSLGIPLRYFGYFLLQDVLPGTVLLYVLGIRPLSPSRIAALAIPTGYALEIFTFLALSAVGAREAMPAIPLVWLAVGAWRLARQRDVAPQPFSSAQLRAGALLGLLGLFTVVSAASQMYAESPLVDGLPQRPIFHDWVYLLSRAAVIKQYWPLQDPSLAGTPLQYHYLFLIHVGAASANTHVALTWILLRLAIVPLGVVLVAQAYVLAKLVARSRLAGVIAAALVIVPGELSSADDYGHLVFLGQFVRWLYVSPTFFFGLIFFGALLIAVPLCRIRWQHLSWLGLLAAAATGAKGSVVPVALCAMALWAAWAAARGDRQARRIALCGATMAVAFVAAYGAMLAACGTGEVLIRPFEICRLTPFWHDYAIPCQRLLKRTLHAPDLGTWLGAAIVALGVIVGSSGVRILAVAHVFRRAPGHRRTLVRWLAIVALVSIGAGLAFHFDGDSELYFFLPQRIPFAVLTAAFLVAVFQPRCAAIAATPRSGHSGLRLFWRITRQVCAAAIVAVTAMQCANTMRCQYDGLCDWLHYDTKAQINSDLLPLYDTLAWIRSHTEPAAVLVSNAFTIKNVARGRGVLVDHTTAGVYYYYSALAERRVWVEGPTYLLDQPEAKRRLCRAANVFYAGKPPTADMLHEGPVYVVLDRSLKDNARIVPSLGYQPVYRNARFDIYRAKASLGAVPGIASVE